MSIYKAYDIRGLAESEITPDLAFRIGCAYASYRLSSRTDSRLLTVVVARDNRETSYDLSRELIRGLVESGIDVVDVGLCPTPMFYFAVQHYGYDGGVSVTASHNPPEYNGFKLVREEAIPMGGDTGIMDIQNLVESGDFTTDEREASVREQSVVDDYVSESLSLESISDLSSLSVVVDTGNGVSVEMIKPFFSHLPAQLYPLYFELDGTFPNHLPNPFKEENIAALKKEVIDKKAHLGIALDADGDRCVFIDEHGNMVRADYITALLAKRFLRTNPGAAIMYDLRSSKSVPEAIVEAGGSPVMSRVGHAFIKQQMREEDALLAGELSAHFYYKSVGYFEAPLLVMGAVMSEMVDSGKSLSELVAPFAIYASTGELNYEIADKEATLSRVRTHFEPSSRNVFDLDGLSMEFDTWWFNLRPSNTEDLLRLNLEADTPEIRDEKLREVEDLLR